MHKEKLEDRKGRCAKELQNILLVYRTTKGTAIGETPFAMVYKTEAVFPTEQPWLNQETTRKKD